MPLQVTAIMIGVEDLARSKKFYGEGLGCAIGIIRISCRSTWVTDRRRLPSTNGRRRLKMPASRPSDPDSGGVSFHYVVPSREAVDEVMRDAVAAGGAVVKEAAAVQWGYFGYFSDPDGYLWKVASAS
jgi:hypothetical protein